ncbi:MAG: hypothetical protein WCI74_16760, partial [Actinomycetes bacterium]
MRSNSDWHHWHHWHHWQQGLERRTVAISTFNAVQLKSHVSLLGIAMCIERVAVCRAKNNWRVNVHASNPFAALDENKTR